MRVQIAFFCIFAIISTTLAESQEVDRDKKGTIYTLIKIIWRIPPRFLDLPLWE
jgi:hypothetical protein